MATWMNCCSGGAAATQICFDGKKGYLLPTLRSKNNLPTFRMSAAVVIRAKEHSVEMSASYFPISKLVTDNLFSVYAEAS